MKRRLPWSSNRSPYGGYFADRWYADWPQLRYLAYLLICRRKDHDWFDMGADRTCKRCLTNEWMATKRGWY